MSNSATDMFDHHPLWEEIEHINSWLAEASSTFSPNYEGAPGSANDYLNRIQVAVETTRLYLQLAPKEAISKALLDEVKAPLARINVELQKVTLDDASGFEQELSDANTAAGKLLSTLNKLHPVVSIAAETKATAADYERQRITGFLDNAQSIVTTMRQELEKHKQTISKQLSEERNELTDLQNQIEELAGSYTEQIDDGVEAGKKRIDDQITTLQTQYSSQVDSQSKNATETLRRILDEIESQKQELDEIIDKTKRVSGYIAENEMSRRFKERANGSRNLWISFIVGGVVVAVVSGVVFWNAGHLALQSTATISDVVRGVIRVLMGLGSAGIAAYLFRQASIQQRIFQDFRSAEVRLGSLDAFLARFEDEDAQEIRRGIGKRVYIDGELGEIESRQIRSIQPQFKDHKSKPPASQQDKSAEPEE
ncbi:MAG: hypothetical protein ACTJGF_03005 [Corynebacterium sp.]